MRSSRLSPHDKNQIELKLAYLIDPAVRRQKYRVELWMFVPMVLGLDADTYRAHEFFSETTNFVRLKTPVVALRSLARKKDFADHFAGLQHGLDALLGGLDTNVALLARDLKLLGAIFRSAVRDEVEQILARVESHRVHGTVGRAAGQDDLVRVLRSFHEQLRSTLSHLRALGRLCEAAATPSVLKTTWAAVDEYTALVSEVACTRLVAAIDGCRSDTDVSDPLRAAREELADLAIEMFRYRQGHGYPSFLTDETEGGEALPHRQRLLKRTVSSVLFLETQLLQPGGAVRDLIGMVTAALAMLVAVLAAIWAQRNWPNFSGAFVAAMVVSYIVKDRIKEWGKRFLGDRLDRLSPTRIVRVRDHEGKKVVGELRETFRLLRPEDLPDDLIAMRHADHPDPIAQMGRREVVVYYGKGVTLRSKDLVAQIPGVKGLNDITRLNLSHLRNRMDDPKEPFIHVNPTRREVVETTCARVYHLNLILRVTSGRGPREKQETRRVRAIVNQDRILRLETVGPSSEGFSADPLTGAAGADVFKD